MPKHNCGWRLRISAHVRHPVRGRLAGQVAAMFGLPEGKQTLYDRFDLQLSPGRIIAVTGPSGSGKSVLLAEVRRRCRRAIALGVASVAASALPPVELLRCGSLQRRLELLSRCGLADAQALITPARNLSGGQQYRLATAVAMHRAARCKRAIILADEFAATLDAATAAMLCRQLRKLISRSRCVLLLATPRTELLADLQPDQVIVKPLGEPATYCQLPIASLQGEPAGGDCQLKDRSTRAEAKTDDAGPLPTREQSAVPNIAIRRGSIKDYHRMAKFHYLAGPPAAHKRVYVARQIGNWQSAIGNVVGVLVVSPPVPFVRGRNILTAGRYATADRGGNLRRLNAEVECISRVVVHPAYRGCGVAGALVRRALADARTPFVEALAAMGAVHPFFERAGMTACRVAPDRYAARLLSAAQAVGLSRWSLGAVQPVRRLLARGGPRARFLRRELDYYTAQGPLRHYKSGAEDRISRACRQATRQYVYYLAATGRPAG